jgi:ketosteroid isomerase-like protein
VTRDEIRKLAEDWVAAWNAHDSEAIISHYDERVELISPVAEQLFRYP